MADTQCVHMVKAPAALATREVLAMETHRFDGLTRNLAASGSRRRVLAAALAGGLLAFLGDRRAGASSEKVRICHKTSSTTTPVVVLEINADALEDHLAHGDVVLGNDHDGVVCCVRDSDCGAGLECCPNGRCDNAGDCGFD
jgi:hypothetical protein